MPARERAVESFSQRIKCPACGTEQELDDARESGCCVICSGRLLEAGGEADGNDRRGDPVDPTRGGGRGLAAIAAALRGEATRGSAAELNELRMAEKRLTSLFALVPLWGPWNLVQSEVHTPREKTRLASFSILLTLVLVAALSMVPPGARQGLDSTEVRIGSQIEALGALVESYATQHRETPDATVWARSAESGDLRFYDPWGRIYRYDRRESGFTIGTHGRDGVEGGSGEDADFFRDFPTPATGER
ncbi:MAG: type II secretion system protein GspG, partial [Candidatus Binatia bacterium]